MVCWSRSILLRKISLWRFKSPKPPAVPDMTHPEAVGGIVARRYGIALPALSHSLGRFTGMATKRPRYLALLQTL